MKKIATTEVPINDVIAQRWSPRAFDSNHVITEDVIKSLFEGGKVGTILLWRPAMAVRIISKKRCNCMV